MMSLMEDNRKGKIAIIKNKLILRINIYIYERMDRMLHIY